MQIISQRTENSNCHSVQWLPSGDHKIKQMRFSREPETVGRGLRPLTSIYKLFIREVAGIQDLTNGKLTPNFSLLNLKNKNPLTI